MKELNEIVAQNIIFLRTENHMTQMELGEQLNYSDKAISKWERAESVPDAYVLKKMSGIFGVTVDYLLNEHNDENQKPCPPKHDRHRDIIHISFLSIWTAALFIFIMFFFFGHVVWTVFVYALPVSIVVLLVLNSLWGNIKYNFYIISVLIWGMIAAIYVSFLEYNLWLLFILGIPAEIILYFSFKLMKKPPF